MSENLWIVVPAAGESKRFRDAGYTTPKPLLKIQDSNGLTLRMVTHVLANLPPLTCPANSYIVALPKGSKIEQPFYPVKEIERTIGQADTVYQVTKELPEDDSILILDCDMILETNDISEMIRLLKAYDVIIAVTRTFDPNASRVDKIPFPTRFVEKEPISEWGIVGARAFRNIGILNTALRYTLERCATINKEPYLSLAINHYAGTKYAFIVSKYTDWGTSERIKEDGSTIVTS